RTSGVQKLGGRGRESDDGKGHTGARQAAGRPFRIAPAARYTLPVKQHLAVSAVGTDRTGIVHELSRVITECGGSISESRMANLGSEFAMLLLISGNWHSLAKIESELKKLGETAGLTINVKRTEPRGPRTDMVPYSVDVVCVDQTGI